MPYAIARIAKLKQANIGGSGMHVSRGRVTPNANRTKPDQNQTLIHHNDQHLPLSQVVHHKIDSTPQLRKIRTDAVYVVEMLLTASPEYFRPTDPGKYGTYEADKLADWSAATKQWLCAEYGDRIVRAELHLDEATPHIHAYLVPTDERGQLNCRKLFGGRAKMFALQDSYAEAMKPLGLERGIKGTVAEHTAVKDYYSVVNAAVNELSLDTPQVTKTKAAAYEQMKRDKEELERRLKVLAQQRDKLAEQLQVSHQTIVTQSQITAALANPQPLITTAQIAVELQLNPVKIAPATDAIDLVTTTLKTNLNGAIKWINNKFGAAVTSQLIATQAQQLTQKVAEIPPVKFIPPAPVKSEWARVRDDLTTTTKLPAKLVDRLHDEGLIYADGDGKLICANRDFDGTVRGATSLDLNSPQGVLVEDSGRSTGWAYFEDRPQVNAERIVIAADLIESMAYSVVNDPDRPTIYLAAHDGGWIPGDLLGNIEVVIATEMELVNLPATVKRHLPTGTSWVEDLKTLTESIIVVTDPLPAIVTPPDPAEMTAQVERQQQLEREAAKHKVQQQSSPPHKQSGRGRG